MQDRRRSLSELGLWLGVLIAAGLGSRQRGMPGFVVLYVGDVLWGALFFVLFACLRPRASTRRVWCWAVATTELIEFSQLYRGELTDRFRATAAGGLMLGHGFLWSDVLCIALGASAAALIDAARTGETEPDPRQQLND